MTQPRDLLERLELELVMPLPVESDVPLPPPVQSSVEAPQMERSIHLALAAILEQPHALDAAGLFGRLMEAPPNELGWLVSADVLELAREMTYAPMVPFEMSPFGLESLLAIVAKGSGVTIGAGVGIVAAGPTPLLLITVPAGMIIGGAAFGVGQALQVGLRSRLLKLMGVKPSESGDTT